MLRSGHPRGAAAQILDAVVQHLEDVFAVMGKGPRIFLGILVVERPFDQRGGPGPIPLAGIREEVGIGVGVVHNPVGGCVISSVSLDGFIEHFHHGVDFTGDAFGGVAVTIPIGLIDADCLQVSHGGYPGVAGAADLSLDGQLVSAVAVGAIGSGFHVLKVPDIGLTVVFVSALNLGAVAGGAGREVVNVHEA